MKILHVIPYYAPAWAYGGTPRAVFEITKHQFKLGHDVSVLTTDAFEKNERFSGGEVLDGVRVYRLRNISNWLCWNFHFAIPANFTGEFMNQSFDVIHLHEVRTPLNYLALTRLSTKRFVISPWGTLPHNNSQLIIKKFLDLFLLPELQKKVQVSFAQTEHEERVLSEFKIGKKKVLVPLGVDFSFFKNLPTKIESKNYLRQRHDVPLVVFLGRFSPHKGIEHLIKAMTQASQPSIRPLKLLLIGRDDGYLSKMKELINQYGVEKFVQVLPPLYERNRLYAYRAADVFVSTPTVYEETATTCLEALACGTPVVTNKFSEIPYSDTIEGIVTVGDSTSELADAITHLLESSAHVNVSKITKIFSWNNAVNEMISNYE